MKNAQNHMQVDARDKAEAEYASKVKNYASHKAVLATSSNRWYIFISSYFLDNYTIRRITHLLKVLHKMKWFNEQRKYTLCSRESSQGTKWTKKQRKYIGLQYYFTLHTLGNEKCNESKKIPTLFTSLIIRMTTLRLTGSSTCSSSGLRRQREEKAHLL